MKKKQHRILLAVIAVILLIVVTSVAVFAGGMFSRNYKIIKAMKHTFSQGHLLKDLDMSAWTDDADYHADIRLDADGNGLDVRYDRQKDIMQLSFEKNLQVSFVNVKLSVISQIEGNTIKVQVPAIGDTVYTYDQFDSSGLSFLDGIGSIQSNEAARKLLLDLAKTIRFEKVADGEYALAGKQTSCDGYETTIPADTVKQLYTELADAFDEKQLKLLNTLHGGNVREDLEKILTGMGDIRLTLYMADNTVTDVKLSSDKTGDTIEATLDAAAEQETVRLEVNGALWLQTVYDTGKKELTASFDDTGRRTIQMEISDTEDGKQIKLEGLQSISCLLGGMDSLIVDEQASDILQELFGKMFENTDLNMTLEIADGSTIEAFSGKQVSITENGTLSLFGILGEILKKFL